MTAGMLGMIDTEMRSPCCLTVCTGYIVADHISREDQAVTSVYPSVSLSII